jgi:hypothetical protein
MKEADICWVSRSAPRKVQAHGSIQRSGGNGGEDVSGVSADIEEGSILMAGSGVHHSSRPRGTAFDFEGPT